ncbi:zeta toxin family protein [Streptomyces sp. NPDC051133]|uniref:zeta toxin family protein n=1 Tax=Streptomyces sp. NPDC051133 TaxID=3155521 RepID=UPI003430134B
MALSRPAAARQPVSQEQSVVVVVAGQPGAGKTGSATSSGSAHDARRGGAHLPGSHKPVHRHYAALLAANVRTVGATVRPDTSRR